MWKKKEKKDAANPMSDEPKEGFKLLGAPKFKPLENGRFKCVETGHELPAHARDAYAESKHCRLGLIDSALARKRPPLNMFRQDPLSRSKLVCKLTGITVNKSEEHIWKHINGKRFLNMLDKFESGKEIPSGVEGKQGEEKEKKDKDGSLKRKKEKKKMMKKKKKKGKKSVDGIGNEGSDPAKENGATDDEDDFWMPPAGERWDHDDGGDRWSDGEDSTLEDGGGEEEEEEEEDAVDEEAEHEAEELSNGSRQMSIETEPTPKTKKRKKTKTC